MIRKLSTVILFLLCCLVFSCPQAVFAQNSGGISGTVTDATGAVVPKATVKIHNPVSQYDRSTTTDTSGDFSFANIPFNPYHLTVTLSGFNTFSQDVDIRSTVPANLKIVLNVAGATSSVTVEASERIWSKPSQRITPTWTANCSTSFPLRVHRLKSVLSSLWPLRELPRIRTGSFTDSVTMHPTRFRWTASLSPISKAKCFPTRFLRILFNPWRSSRERLPQITAGKPAWLL